jgi:hypothetical protein
LLSDCERRRWLLRGKKAAKVRQVPSFSITLKWFISQRP